MKIRILFFTCLIVILAWNINLPVYADDNLSGVVTLDSSSGNITAGTLQTRIEATGITDAVQVIELHIGNDVSGELNATDILYIDSMVNIEVIFIEDTVSITEMIHNRFCDSFNTTDFDALRQVRMPAASFDSSAFLYCPNLSEVHLPLATSFGDHSFSNCTSLASVYMPLARTFHDGAFRNCDSLIEINLPLAETFSDSAFYDCDSLTTVNLPQVASFSDGAFTSCNVLETLELANAVTFGDSAFSESRNLQTLVLPKATSFGVGSFYYCENLINFTLGTDIPTIVTRWGATWGDYLPAVRTVYVPTDRISSYDENIQHKGGTSTDNLWEGWIIHPLDMTSPNITQHPSDITCNTGETKVISVSASTSDNGILTYQWYSNTVNSNVGGSLISNPSIGSNTSNLSFPTNTAGIYYYYCLVTSTNIDPNVTGLQTATTVSDVATVSINQSISTNTKNTTHINTIPNRKRNIPETNIASIYENEIFTIDLSNIFEDVNLDTLTYKVTINESTYIDVEEIYSYSSAIPGSIILKFIANDGISDSVDTYVLTLEIKEQEKVNTRPNRRSDYPETEEISITNMQSFELDLSEIFEDIDGDPLTYKVSLDDILYDSTDKEFAIFPSEEGIMQLSFKANDGMEDSSDIYTVLLKVTEEMKVPLSIHFQEDSKIINTNIFDFLTSICPITSTDGEIEGKVIIWESSNSDVVSIEGSQIVTHAAGKTTITIYSDTNEYLDSMIIEVIDDAEVVTTIVETSDNLVKTLLYILSFIICVGILAVIYIKQRRRKQA